LLREVWDLTILKQAPDVEIFSVLNFPLLPVPNTLKLAMAAIKCLFAGALFSM
jgi:hypothetical protein